MYADPSATCDPEEGGTVAAQQAPGVEDHWNLTATPNTGYRFVKWTYKDDGDSRESDSNPLNVSSECNDIVAHFELVHTHSFTYEASGATITATCTAEGCDLPSSSEGGTDHVAKLTIVAPAHTTYNDEQSANATITDENNIKGEATIVYKNGDTTLGSAPTSAGTYTASITVGGATATIGYTINKADPTATAPTATATYGQTLADVTLTNPTGNTDGTWAFVDEGTTSVGDEGEHTFKANFTPTDATNYNSKSTPIHLRLHWRIQVNVEMQKRR